MLSNSISSNHNESEDLICLAENIYWEARNQSLEGKLAVAHVTINRVESKKFPNDVCSVVKQTKYYPSGKIDLHSCQFSWYCDGKSDNPKNLESWRDAKKIAEEFLKRKPIDIKDAASLGIDINPRIENIKVEEPPVRQKGIMVSDVSELVQKLKHEAKVI